MCIISLDFKQSVLEAGRKRPLGVARSIAIRYDRASFDSTSSVSFIRHFVVLETGGNGRIVVIYDTRINLPVYRPSRWILQTHINVDNILNALTSKRDH